MPVQQDLQDLPMFSQEEVLSTQLSSPFPHLGAGSALLKPFLKSNFSLKHSADTRAQVPFHTVGADVAVLIIGAQYLAVLEVFAITIIPQVRAVLLFPLYC